jgi:hypothetical protein
MSSLQQALKKDQCALERKSFAGLFVVDQTRNGDRR